MLLLLQEFVFSSINFYGYCYIWAYLMFLIMLPLQMSVVPLMLFATATGAVMDIFGGTSALITASMVATTFVRPAIVKFSLPHDVISVGGAPLSYRVGAGSFLRYCATMCLVYGVVHFTLEIMSLQDVEVTLLKLLSSVVLNTVLIFILQLPLRPRK